MDDIARAIKLPLFQPGQPSQVSDRIKENQKQLLRCWPKSYFIPDWDMAAVERMFNRQRKDIDKLAIVQSVHLPPIARDWDFATVERVINRQRVHMNARDPKIYFDG